MNSFTRYIAPSPEARYRSKLRNMAATMEQVVRAEKPSISMGGTTTAPVPKGEYIRSEALMRAYRQIPCQNCGKDDGTVCGAHSNWAMHGKGKAIKASDEYCASLCFTCHGELDQGAVMGASERFTLWMVAHVKTIRELLVRGLWPKGVPMPEGIEEQLDPNHAFAKAQYGHDYTGEK